ncbi:MAG: signal peptidase I [Candidatus Diapherotrites archaeon]|nr:signal peptidase I [Candidatus Diapherotrites archaeon]MDZ4256814.1 signal peptidase I [archaeon]
MPIRPKHEREFFDVDVHGKKMHHLRRWAKPIFYAAFLISILILILVLITLFSYVASAENACQETNPDCIEINIVGDSMFPAFQDGDKAWLWDGYYENHLILPDQVVGLVYVNAFGNRIQLVKRVMGVPGEMVEFSDDTLRIGDRIYRKERNQFHALQVQLKYQGYNIPPGYILVRGDNPNESRDSKEYGIIPLSWAKGRVFPKAQAGKEKDI